MKTLVLSVLLCTPPAVLPQGLVRVVDDDGGPGVDHLDIQSAVDAASDSDCILVRAGEYDGFAITAKSLTVVGTGHDVVVGQPVPLVVGPNVTIEQIGPTQSVVLANLTVDPPFVTVGIGSFDCEGPVWIEGVQSAGIGAANCDQVILVDASVTSAGVLAGFSSFQTGLDGEDSAIRVYDTTVTGLFGGLGCLNDAAGGHGAWMKGGELFLSGVALVAGDGGEVLSCTIFTGSANGGHGLIVDAASVRTVDSTMSGGAAGSDCCLGSTPVPGQDVVLQDGGTVEHIPGVARRVVLDSPVPEGTPATLTYSGEEGDLVLLIGSFIPSVLDLGGVVGPLVVGLPWTTTLSGLLPAGSELDLPVQIPGVVNPLIEYRTYYLQAAFVSTQGTVNLGAPTALVVIGDSIPL